MRILVPLATAVLLATVGLSATAAVPAAIPGSAPISSAQASSAQASSTQVGTTTAKSAHRVATDTTPVVPRGDFVWPLAPRPQVVRRFERPRAQWSAGHRGVDLSAAVGQRVLSAGEGVVAFSGVIAGRGVITIRHSTGLRTSYEPVDRRLASGVLVHRGTGIGIVSPTPGHCVPRTCLHWGAISGQTYRDPLSLLGFSRPILLPIG